MSKYLILGFKNAGLFRKHKGTKDIMFDIDGRRKRVDEEEFVEPITVYQISNVLHVLFGERPKPINRVTVYDSVPYLFDKAMSSYLRIDSYKNNRGEYYVEMMQMKKSVGNSYKKDSLLNWNRIHRLLGDELYEIFVKTIVDVFNVVIEDITFNEVKEKILKTSDKRLDDLFELLIKNQKKALYRFVYATKDTELADINKNHRTQLTVLTAPDKIIRLDGQILVPVTDDDIDKIRQNKGCATILDGGLVFIKKIQSGNTLSTFGFTEVKNISLEKR
jgi:hypothetical protein